MKITRFAILLKLFSIALSVHGQDISVNIPGNDAFGLMKLLAMPLADTSKADVLLKLAKYHLDKGEQNFHLDSAKNFLYSAKTISPVNLSGKRKALILLYEAYLARYSGKQDSGRQFARQAIKKLQGINEQFHLAEAYLELSRFYDSNEPGQQLIINSLFDSLFRSAPIKVIASQRDSCMSMLLNFYLKDLNNGSYNLTAKSVYAAHLARSYQSLNNKLLEFWSRKELADIHYQQGKLDQAIAELLQIAREQEDGKHPNLCFTYDLLSGLYAAGGRIQKAMHYSLQSIRSVKTKGDSLYLGHFYERMAFNCSQTGSMAEGVDWNLKSLEYRIRNKQSEDIFSLLQDLTETMIKLGRGKEGLDLILTNQKVFKPQSAREKNYLLLGLAQCYAATHDYTSAEKYCKALIKLHQLRLNSREITKNAILHQFLANFYFNTGDYKKSEYHFERTIEDWPKSGEGLGQLFKSHLLFKLDSVKGKYVSAIKHLQNYQVIKDSMLTATKTKQLEDLKIEYATEQKDSLIRLKEMNIKLLTARDELQVHKLEQGALLRDISIGVATLLIIITLLLYNRYRLKQRTNKELELQQSEITRQNHTLSHMVNEKDWLVKEIHHRVKNNLQIVMSLLNSQSAYIENDAALTAIHDSQHRVFAMSLIHQKLYGSDNLASIDMSVYIRELGSYLAESFNTGQRIRFKYEIEPLELDVSQAVPIGLILNEAITNSIKYAFPNQANGNINISLSTPAPSQYILTVADDGIGMSTEPGSRRRGSLGFSLMAGLSEDLNGRFMFTGNNGTTIKVSFLLDRRINQFATNPLSPISEN